MNPCVTSAQSGRGKGNMELELKRRREQKPGCTMGELLVDGYHECWTLEDEVRAVKIPGKTAIPEGRYEVVIDMSARFGREMPHILNVPGFTGVRIHTGNTDADTEGCILVGETRGANLIFGSKAAYKRFFPKLQAALAEGKKVFIKIGYEDLT